MAAANKYNRIVQHGTQSRSSAGAKEAIQHLRDGLIGDVYLSRGLCFKWRDTIGRTPKSAVPAGVNYDLWLGPAPDRGFTHNRFHYNWHWFWDTGNGDLGNQGIHEVDTARWGLGVGFPTKVSAIGGHVMFDDDQETPNVLNCAFEFDSPNGTAAPDGVRSAALDDQPRSRDRHIGARARCRPPVLPLREARATAAAKLGSGQRQAGHDRQYLTTDRRDTWRFRNTRRYKSWLGDKNEPGPEGKGKENHFANFIDCVRSREEGKPRTRPSRKATSPPPWCTWRTCRTAWAARCTSIPRRKR